MSAVQLDDYGRLLAAVLATVGTGFLIALIGVIVADFYKTGKK